MASTESIKCPRCDDLALRKWLPPEERQMLTKVDGDVFEIRCDRCGQYETTFPEDRAEPQSAN